MLVASLLAIVGVIGLVVAWLGHREIRRLRAEIQALVTRLERLEIEAMAPVATPAVVAPPSRARLRPTIQRVDRPSHGPTLIAVPNLATTKRVRPRAEASAQDLKRRHAAIWELAQSGASSQQIAAATRQPIGRVELILGLRRQSASEVATTGGPGR